MAINLIIFSFSSLCTWNVALSRAANLTHIKAAEIHGIRLGVIVRFTDITMEACTTGSRIFTSLRLGRCSEFFRIDRGQG